MVRNVDLGATRELGGESGVKGLVISGMWTGDGDGLRGIA